MKLLFLGLQFFLEFSRVHKLKIRLKNSALTLGPKLTIGMYHVTKHQLVSLRLFTRTYPKQQNTQSSNYILPEKLLPIGFFFRGKMVA